MVVVIVAIVYARCYLLSVWNVHGESEKKQDKKTVAHNSPNINRFKKKDFC